MTVTGSGTAKSRMKSKLSSIQAVSRSPVTISSMWLRRPSILCGVQAFVKRRRKRVWSGGSRNSRCLARAARYHGSQPGRLQLTDTKLKVKRPRLATQNRRRSKSPCLRNAAQRSGTRAAYAGCPAAGCVDTGIPGSLAADGGGGGVAQRDQPQRRHNGSAPCFGPIDDEQVLAVGLENHDPAGGSASARFLLV
jgi:hypothetical protein